MTNFSGILAIVSLHDKKELLGNDIIEYFGTIKKDYSVPIKRLTKGN